MSGRWTCASGLLMEPCGRRAGMLVRKVVLIPPDPRRIEDRIPLSREDAYKLMVDLADELGYTIHEDRYDDKA